MAEVRDKLIETVTVSRGLSGTLSNYSLNHTPNPGTGDGGFYYEDPGDPASITYFDYVVSRGFVPALEFVWSQIVTRIKLDVEAAYQDPPDDPPLIDSLLKTVTMKAYLDAGLPGVGGALPHSSSATIATEAVTIVEQEPVINESVTFSISLGGSFEKRARYAYYEPANEEIAERIWGYYPAHYSPHGLPRAQIEYYYVPPDAGITLSATVSHGGSQILNFSATYDWEDLGYADIDAYRAAFEEGMPEFELNLAAVHGADGYFCRGDLTHHGGAQPALSATLSGDGMEFEFSKVTAGGNWVGSGGALTWTAIGPTWVSPYWEPNSAYLHGTAGEYTITHTGTVRHLDGEGVAGAEIEFDDNTPALTALSATTGSGGAFSASRTYEGIWEAQLVATVWDSATSSYLGAGSTTTTNDAYEYHGATAITNIQDLEEPIFPAGLPTEGRPAVPYDTDWTGFDDGSMRFASGVFAWSNAASLSAAASLRVIDWSSSYTGWTLSGGTATLAIVGGALQISGVTGSPVLSKDMSGECWAGARRLELDYDTDSDLPLTLTAAGSEWEITEDAPAVDVLAPVNRNGFGHTGSVLGGSWPWYWGVNDPGTVSLAGFEPGRTYTLRGLDLKRLTEAEGGTLRAVIYNQGPFVGDEMNLARTTDQHLRLTTGGTYLEQGGLVILDGVVAAEIATTEREYVPPAGMGSFGYWIITGVEFADPRACQPGGGLLSYTDNTTEATAAWLVGGSYSHYSSLTLAAAVQARALKAPPCWGDLTLTYAKVLRGRALVQVIPAEARSVTLRRQWGGLLIDWTSYTTAANGAYWLPALQQPRCELVTIGPGVDASHVTVSGLGYATCRYEGLRIYVPGSDGTHQARTIDEISGGVITLASALSSTPDAGATGYIQIPVQYYLSIDGDYLLCSESTGQLLHHPATGELLYGGLGGLFESRNHALQYILIKLG